MPEVTTDSFQTYIQLKRSLAILRLGNFFGCAITTESKLYCWGGDDDGEASFGSSESNVFPPEEIMTMPDLQAWTDVAIGRNHICARSGDGEIWCAR